MTGLFIFAGLIVVGFVALIYYKIKWGRASRKEADMRSGDIERDRADEKSRGR